MGMPPHLYPDAFALSDSNEIGSRLSEVFSKNIFLGGFRIFLIRTWELDGSYHFKLFGALPNLEEYILISG